MGFQALVSIDTAPSSSEAAPGLSQLERQVERGQLFAHTALGESALRLGEVEVFLHGLVDTLLAKGVIAEEDMVAAMSKVRAELEERNELNRARTMVRSEDPANVRKTATKVDCQTRLHICHAACCRLDFALSIPEVESGKVKWDLGRPYFIRRDSHGSCVHFDPQSGGCQVYSDRPGVCREYSCADDHRIWKNFDEMELNQEWIDAHLSAATEPHLVQALMHGPNQLTQLNDAEKAHEQGGTP